MHITPSVNRRWLVKATLLCLTTLIALSVDTPLAANEQQNLVDLLASGARIFSDEAAALQDCYVADEEFEALIAEIVRDVRNLDIERSRRRVNFAAKTHKNHPQLKLIDAELDIQSFRFDAALVKIDSVMSQCSLEKRLHLRKAMVLIGMGRLDAAETELDNAALQLFVPSQVAYVRGLIAYHRGDLAMMRSQFRKVTTPKLLKDHVQALLGSPAQPPDEAAPVDDADEDYHPVTRLDTPLKSILALGEAIRDEHQANVSKQIEAFVATYPNMALTWLFAFYAAYETEDFTGAEEYLDRFEFLAPDYPLQSMLRGRLARAQGRFEIAMAAYVKQISLTPGYRWPYEELFDAYIEAGRYTDLIDLENQFVDELPENYHQLMRTAKAYRSLGRFEESFVWYDKALVLDPSSSLAYRGKANGLVSLARWDMAKQNFEKSLEISPGNSEGLVGLAKVLRYQEKHEEAKKYLEEALRLWPNSLLANIELALLNYKLGNAEAALRTCDSLSRKMVMGYFQQVNLAFCYEHSGDMTRALALYRKLYEEDSQPHILKTIGQILQRQGRLDEARATLKQALAQDGGGDLTIRQAYANVLYDAQAWSEAEAQYREIVRYQQDRYLVWFFYGEVQLRQKKYAGALAAYDKSLALGSDFFDLVYSRAFCLEKLERNAEAEKWFNKLLDVPSRALKARTELAKFYFRRLDYHTALLHTQAGLMLAESDPILLQMAADASHNTQQNQLKVQYSLQLIGTEHELPRYMSWVAIDYAGKGQLAEAETLFLKAVAAEPKNHHYWNSLGYTYYLQDRLAEALKTYEKALSVPGKKMGIIYYNIGLTHQKLLDKEKAGVAFRSAHKLGYPPNG